MENTYAVVKNGLVENIIVMDSNIFNADPNSTNYGGELVLVTASGGIGWEYDGSNFIPPTIPAPTKEQIYASTISYRDGLLETAKEVTNDWRTELALEIINDDDKKKLISWMKYVQQVKAVDLSTSLEIAWPTSPS